MPAGLGPGAISGLGGGRCRTFGIVTTALIRIIIIRIIIIKSILKAEGSLRS